MPQIIAWAREWLELVKALHRQHHGLYASFGHFRSNMLSLVGSDGRLEFYDGTLRARDADGTIILDHIAPADFRRPTAK